MSPLPANFPAPPSKRFGVFTVWLRSESSVHELTEAVFLRALGLIYLAAFSSLYPQIIGLVGSHGIAPADAMLAAAHSQFAGRAFSYLPTFFWWNASDFALQSACLAGCVAAVCLTFGFFMRVATLLCFVLYLSLSVVGQPFTSFQWDALLLEAGFLAIFAGSRWLSLVYRLLLFRLIFESGWVKIASGDPNWRHLHALRFHFMTQPLPNPIAYCAYRLPASVLDFLTVLALAIEFLAPFLLFAPRRWRRIGVALLILLQIAIILTGNYAFFNLLTLALCLWTFDEQTFSPLAPLLRWRFPRFKMRLPSVLANAAVLILGALGLIQLAEALMPSAVFETPLALVQPFQVVNSYGLFAVMTTKRPEIVLEGSNDQLEWREYQFPYKPGNTHRGLPWVAPYQPRLDWQMWFAALGSYQGNSWVGGLMYRILTGEPSVYRLLSRPPFAKPPRYLRAMLYDYDFSTPAERRRTGAVWQRKLRAIWLGPASLRQ